MLNDFMVSSDFFGAVVVTEEQKELARRYMIKFDAQDLFEMLEL